jgi:predicted ATPase
VGRENELAVLVSAFARVRETRTPELVSIVGEPGMGKSRIVHELAAAVDQSVDISWWQGRSIPYGRGVSFWALAQIVKAQADILESDSSEAAADKLTRLVATVVGERDAGWVTRHVRPLLALGDEGVVPADRRDEAFAAWRRFFEALAERRPLVLVFEDIHWADDGLLDFIDSLVGWLRSVPLLVLATARPELRERRGASGNKAGARTALTLTSLSEEETARLLDHLLAPGSFPSQAYADLLLKVGGNPLYVEQYARLVQERPHTHGLTVPDTVRATIAARIDALPPMEKSVLQSAAVFHKVFWTGAAATVEETDRLTTAACLHALERKRFVQRVRRSSVAGETEYAFAHVLLREVAYDQLPRAARAERHQRAAAWIESLGRSDDHAELLSHHYLSALQLRRAAGDESDELARQVYHSLSRAGERAFALHAYDGAVRHFERALELAPPDDPRRPHLLFRYASALHLTVDTRAEETLEAARRALLASGQGYLAAEADALLADMWWHRAQGQRLEKHLKRALGQLDERAPKATRARVLEAVARFRANTEEGEGAIPIAREALATAEEVGSPELVATILVTLGTARWKVRDRGGIDDVERALALALASDDAVTILPRAYINLANIVARDGDAARAEELIRTGQRAADRVGDRNQSRFARANIIYYTTFLGGDWDEALRLADEFVAECEVGSGQTLAHQVHSTRAAIYLGRDDVEAAVAEYRVALELARGCDSAMSLRRQLADNAEAYVELGQLQQARALADEVLRGGDTVRSYWAWNVFSLGLVAEPLGVTDALLALLGSSEADSFEERVLRHLLVKDFGAAADMMAASGRPTREALLRLRVGRALIDQGVVAEGHMQLEKALAFYRSVGATRYIREANALLAGVKSNRDRDKAVPRVGG